MSGRSNVVWWLQQHGYEPTDERVERLFRAAKEARSLLEDDALHALAKQAAAPAQAGG
jgi:isopropylmalate/homocitrate/citramalate synthase